MSDDVPMQGMLLPPSGDPTGQLGALDRRLRREREARKAAEELLERKSRELFEANETLRREIAERLEAQRELARINRELERRIEERTQDLEKTNARLEQAMREYLEVERSWRAARDAADHSRMEVEARMREEAARIARGLESLRTGLEEVLSAATADAMRSGAAAMAVAIDELQAQAIALANPETGAADTAATGAHR